MADGPNPGEARRLERIRALLEKDLAAEQTASGVESLIGGTFEAAVAGLAAPAERATVLAVDSGMVLLRYADQDQSWYWVPLANIQWLRVVSQIMQDA